MKSRGFSMVELIIVITIMGILLTMGVVNFTSTQVTARDKERSIDIETLVIHLENFYYSGSDEVTDIGEYPSVQFSTGIIGNETTYLRDLNTDTIKAPSQTVSSLVAATNNVQTTAGVLPQPTINQYVYQPIANDGSLCDDIATKECRKFNIYYRTEADNTVQSVESKNQ